MYKWTFAQIAEMTPYQQLQAIMDGGDNPDIIHFRTDEEYERWLASRNF